jgi:two-component system sensor histidine kinase RegB
LVDLASFSWLILYPSYGNSSTIGGQGFLLPFPFNYAFILLILCLVITLGVLLRKTNQLNRSLNATQLALAKEQKMAALGALAAASAHELGSPLSTISLVAKDMLSSLPEISPLLEDVRMIISQGDRCRDILNELSENFRRDESFAYQSLPLSAIIDRAGQPHKLPHIRLAIHKEAPDPEPHFLVTPDLVHGLGNILQNAFQFATSHVRVTLRWDGNKIEALVRDDGKGYPPALIGRLGEPPTTTSKTLKGQETRKAGGMGIGLFIAKTLLMQRQAQVSFFNDEGAFCLIRWPASIRVSEPKA